MKCRVCKKPVAPQYQEYDWYNGVVAAPHPAKNKPGLCDGSGQPEKGK